MVKTERGKNPYNQDWIKNVPSHEIYSVLSWKFDAGQLGKREKKKKNPDRKGRVKLYLQMA